MVMMMMMMMMMMMIRKLQCIKWKLCNYYQEEFNQTLSLLIIAKVRLIDKEKINAVEVVLNGTTRA